ncbi:hypothetical protein [Fulvivirga lutea]|uniref:Lipoprotein n=1 Tax=Fulvivirga lutea TaxID=2810512 RepID=A0A974WJ34_9BACT|nr:hypothetical protein [Fulvivirga lutea]QSE98137.1 hypothetical protein JR347_03375 [Fulvivirga lutea]
MKYLLFIVSVGILSACSSAPKEEVSEELKSNTESVEAATEELDQTTDDLEKQMEKTTQEVDSLLKDI